MNIFVINSEKNQCLTGSKFFFLNFNYLVLMHVSIIKYMTLAGTQAKLVLVHPHRK